ncbi:MAG: FkbM family methyltransferase [Gammaproteobacteria bacterium]|nr:FkbM family methyltransferase [Gammaproteobacteria bacterium]
MMLQSDLVDQDAIANAYEGGRYADVVALFDESAWDPTSVQGASQSSLFAQALAEVGRFEDAANCYLKAFSFGLMMRSPWSVSAGLRKLKLLELDVTLWRQWCDRNPEKIPGWIQLSKSLELAGELADAADVLREVTQRFPQRANLHAQLGMCSLRCGEMQAAISAFQRALAIDSMQPPWVRRGISALQDERLELKGVRLSVPAAVVSPGVLRFLVEGGYEGREVTLLEGALRADDRVLELGAGLGFLACKAGQMFPGIEYYAVEANPALMPVIRENFQLNACCAKAFHGAACTESADAISFHAADDFWASSLKPVDDAHTQISVPTIDVRPLMGELKPTMMIIDIEGGEIDLFDGLELSSVDRVIIELHPLVYGHAGSSKVISALLGAGLHLDVVASCSQVLLFRR